MRSADGEPCALAGDSVDTADWECPGMSVHPGRVLAHCISLTWHDQPLGPDRVVEHTCACRAVVYELVTIGGTFQIHSPTQSEPPQHAYAGSWRRAEAATWWLRLLLGSAR